MTFKFRDAAHITKLLGVDVRDTTIPDHVLLWRAFITMAERAKAAPTATLDGRDGYLLTVAGWALAEMLFGREEENRERIIAAFKAAGRAGLVNRRSKANPTAGRPDPTYWVSATPSVIEPDSRLESLTRREAAVSAAEAGEDRPAAPVIVRRPQRKLKPIKKIIRSQADKAAFTELIYETIKDSPIPLALTELVPMLAETTGVYGISVYAHTVSALVKEGRLFKRPESTEEHARRIALLHLGGRHGRPYMLFWASADIPERRTLPDVVPVKRFIPGESDDIRFRRPRQNAAPAQVATRDARDGDVEPALDVEALAAEAEAGYDVERITPVPVVRLSREEKEARNQALHEASVEQYIQRPEDETSPFASAIHALLAERAIKATELARVEAAIEALRAL